MEDTNIKRFTLRMDAQLFEQVKEKAKENHRAIGAEIEFRLEQQLKKEQK